MLLLYAVEEDDGGLEGHASAQQGEQLHAHGRGGAEAGVDGNGEGALLPGIVHELDAFEERREQADEAHGLRGAEDADLQAELAARAEGGDGMPHHGDGEHEVPLLVDLPAADVAAERVLEPVLADASPVVYVGVLVAEHGVLLVEVGLGADLVQLLAQVVREEGPLLWRGVWVEGHGGVFGAHVRDPCEARLGAGAAVFEHDVAVLVVHAEDLERCHHGVVVAAVGRGGGVEHHAGVFRRESGQFQRFQRFQCGFVERLRDQVSGGRVEQPFADGLLYVGARGRGRVLL